MTAVPPEAITAESLYLTFQEHYAQRTKSWADLAPWEREGWAEFIAAAAPLLRAEGAAAERARLRQALLGCLQCGAIHEPYEAQGHSNISGPFTYTSWAAPDGHAYQARFHDSARQFVADLLRDVP